MRMDDCPSSQRLRAVQNQPNAVGEKRCSIRFTNRLLWLFPTKSLKHGCRERVCHGHLSYQVKQVCVLPALAATTRENSSNPLT